MEIQTADELLKEQLKLLYSIENQLIDAIPDIIAGATDEKLRLALQEHLEATIGQKQRLEEIGRDYKVNFNGKVDESMADMIRNGINMAKDIGDPNVKDTAILAGVDKVEHYEMAAYQSAIDLAKQLDEKGIVGKLNATLDEEKQAAQTVERISGKGIAETIQDILS